MHTLNKVLVYKEEGFDMSEPKSELIDDARCIAESETEAYYGAVYDWRETETAGRWEDEYPEQVYFASDNIDWFISEINEAVQSQKDELARYMAELTEKSATNLTDIVPVLMSDEREPEQSKYYSSATAFALWKVARLAYGEYNCDSYIFNAKDRTARIYSEDIEAIKREPDKWALVMFDYHF